MAVKIRLMRVGKKKQPSYRVVVADARSPRDGRIIETIGHYGPREEPSGVRIDSERALGWLRRGAKPTETVQKLLAASGVWAAFETEQGRGGPAPDRPAPTRDSPTHALTARPTDPRAESGAAPPSPVAAAPARAGEAEPGASHRAEAKTADPGIDAPIAPETEAEP